MTFDLEQELRHRAREVAEKIAKLQWLDATGSISRGDIQPDIEDALKQLKREVLAECQARGWLQHKAECALYRCGNCGSQGSVVAGEMRCHHCGRWQPLLCCNCGLSAFLTQGDQ